MYKIVFSDIDGTLLNHDRELSPSTISTIKELKDKLPFVLISARMPAAMRHLQANLDINEQPIICYNGGLILVDGQAVSSTEIPLNTLESLCDFNQNMNCHLSLYHSDEWYVPEYDQWAAREENNTKVKPEIKSNNDVLSVWKQDNKGAHKIMAMGDEAHIDKIKDYLSENFPEQLHLYCSKPTYLEISNKEISKLTAIKFLLKNHFKITTEETIAFGDNYNDVEMIKGVGMGVAVGNARKEVLEVANIVTQSGKEDGVANSLKELFKI
ncbi:Cof-type HAD-IIB family hydrolase [Salegentibacter sp. LM13S]|uniref:HAD family hydrolase n=1 Tax=Salegentibacter lacus TaxID=2873599 RepID=UPI001CCEA610|nr:HAD family hydrolase [Salegentibacter lacus]MBZ9631948.1 Cof-type HAD-IIB family hydrolase [Salegentibacter lacus]